MLIDVPSKDDKISLFRCFRKALKVFPKKPKSEEEYNGPLSPFALVTDTTAKVIGFSPPLYLDPSARSPGELIETLYHPFYRCAFVDIYEDDKAVLPLSDLDKKERLFMMGRPFWGGYIKVLQGDNPQQE
jgi:hypothetical protein